MNDLSFFTKAVHAGEDQDDHHGALSVPIYQASVFAFADADEAAAIHNEVKTGYYYGRLGNPTQHALESAMASLEGTESSVALASGMAAVSGTILSLVKTGEHIVAPLSGYSTTINFLRHLSQNFGIKTTFIENTDVDSYVNAVNENTKLFWIETPSNPLLRITDIAAVTNVARSRGITSVVDNTFATPFNQRPFELGAHAVIHSATKYLGGHSDLTAGVVAGGSELIQTVRNTAGKLYGGNIAPQVAWLVLRGIKTLALRMERHNSNAYALAYMLSTHPKVVTTQYPGLATHPDIETSKRQMKGGFGGMIAFDLGESAAAKRFVNAVNLCTIATSLGGVETILQHSASMTHATLSAEERLKAGVTDGLIRMSVGIESIDDLAADVEQALAGV